MGEAKSAPLRVSERYVLYDAIASGATATVHIGRLTSARGFGKTVAIKRLHPHLAESEAFRAILVEEARLAARISHPNVVQVLDVVDARWSAPVSSRTSRRAAPPSMASSRANARRGATTLGSTWFVRVFSSPTSRS
jgi:hypothetical protein